MADNGADLIIAHASGYNTAAPEIAAEFGVPVAIVDNPGAVTAGLVADYTTSPHEGAYLAGFLAAKSSRLNKLGIVVSGEPPSWNSQSAGFADGARSANPDVELLYAVIGPAAYSDAAGANRVTTALIAAGADIIFGQGDGASFGMLEAIETNEAADGGKVLFIDVIGNKSSIDDGGHLLSSVLWDFSGAFERMIADIEAGTFGQSNYDLGLADGSVDLLQTDLISADLWAEVQDLKQQILDGSVTVENIADADGVHARMSSVDVAGDDSAAVAGGGEKVLKIAVTAPEKGNDFGWNQQGVDGAIAAAAAFGIEIEVADALGYGDVRPVLRELADNGADLIIAHASGYNTAAPEIAAEFGVPVAIVDNPGAVTAGLVADYTTSPHEGAYLAGFLAAKSSRLNKLGIVVSGEPPSWNSQSAGFADGARSANPDVELLYAVIGPAAYSDAAGANRVTTALIAAGADIIFGQGDGASFGMLEAIETNEAADGGKVLFIDVIGNKSSIDDGGHLLSSVLWDFSGAFERMIADIEAGTFGQSNYDLGLADGSVDLLQTDLISADLWAEVQDLKQQILDGSVTVENIADADGVHARMSSVDVAEG